MNLTFLRWNCNHQNEGELRQAKGKLICETCKKEVEMWVEPALEAVNMDDFPALTKLSAKGAQELQQFAMKVREWERARLRTFASGKNDKHEAVREVLREYEAEARQMLLMGT